MAVYDYISIFINYTHCVPSRASRHRLGASWSPRQPPTETPRGRQLSTAFSFFGFWYRVQRIYNINKGRYKSTTF